MPCRAHSAAATRPRTIMIAYVMQIAPRSRTTTDPSRTSKTFPRSACTPCPAMIRRSRRPLTVVGENCMPKPLSCSPRIRIRACGAAGDDELLGDGARLAASDNLAHLVGCSPPAGDGMESCPCSSMANPCAFAAHLALSTTTAVAARDRRTDRPRWAAVSMGDRTGSAQVSAPVRKRCERDIIAPWHPFRIREGICP